METDNNHNVIWSQHIDIIIWKTANNLVMEITHLYH